ncbi:hypothetical protein JKP88DRAFT_267957 [Tribonema minus]|uniref:Uncharacterized protein n=1 Tax=Tribonema minus TaxID=303371 RepID=A0A835Z5Z8_9STRA|nr:hypothetical protein JKP88DRAFT_267957 [Tribonema minus]
MKKNSCINERGALGSRARAQRRSGAARARPARIFFCTTGRFGSADRQRYRNKLSSATATKKEAATMASLRRQLSASQMRVLKLGAEGAEGVPAPPVPENIPISPTDNNLSPCSKMLWMPRKPSHPDVKVQVPAPRKWAAEAGGSDGCDSSDEDSGEESASPVVQVTLPRPPAGVRLSMAALFGASALLRSVAPSPQQQQQQPVQHVCGGGFCGVGSALRWVRPRRRMLRASHAGRAADQLLPHASQTPLRALKRVELAYEVRTYSAVSRDNPLSLRSVAHASRRAHDAGVGTYRCASLLTPLTHIRTCPPPPRSSGADPAERVRARACAAAAALEGRIPRPAALVTTAQLVCLQEEEGGGGGGGGGGQGARGPPADAAQAREFLASCASAGAAAVYYTAVAVTNSETGAQACAVDEVRVEFGAISADAMDRIVARPAVLDCAGALCLSDADVKASVLAVRGAVDSAWGLPAEPLCQLLRQVT